MRFYSLLLLFATVRLSFFDITISKTSNSLYTVNSKFYDNITLVKEEILQSSGGTKSVLFNASGTKLYAMNLEGLSVYEFSREQKKRLRQFKFKPHKGIGWDYESKLPIPSWQEKPVEACFSNNDKILWVSLHNAEGIVPIKIDEDFHCPKNWDTALIKPITITNIDGSSYKIDAPLIKTGLTPKVIAIVNNQYLLVSNWHSKTISILNVANPNFPCASFLKNIKVEAIPRGICVNDKLGKSYVAIMGSNSIAVIDNKTWTLERYIRVASNPRHIVLGDNNRMYVSFNSLNQVACIDEISGLTLYTSVTHHSPRSIVLSKNKKFLFVTCYNSNTIDVLKISNNSFIPLYSINCPGKPVGIDLYEDERVIEAWVCNYVGGNIKVLTFVKN